MVTSASVTHPLLRIGGDANRQGRGEKGKGREREKEEEKTTPSL